jgi:hypothetical protein
MPSVDGERSGRTPRAEASGYRVAISTATNPAVKAGGRRSKIASTGSRNIATRASRLRRISSAKKAKKAAIPKRRGSELNSIRTIKSKHIRMFPSFTSGHHKGRKILVSSPSGRLPSGALGILINDSVFKALWTSRNKYYLVATQEGADRIEHLVGKEFFETACSSGGKLLLTNAASGRAADIP